MQLKNHSLMKKVNRARTLDVIRRSSQVARSKIASELHLDKKSITNFINEFKAESLVLEAGKLETGHGRPFELLELNRKLLVFAFYISPCFVRAAAVDLYGGVKGYFEQSHNLGVSREGVRAAISKLWKRLRKKYGRPLGIGICMPGLLDIQAQKVVGSVNLSGLDGADISDIVAPEMLSEGVNIYFEEATRAGALAEKWFGAAQNTNDFVCIDVAGGIGAGIINNRRLFKGAGSYAGEIGHVIIAQNGKLCRCGHRGCLEPYISELALLERINAVLPQPVSRFEDLDIAQIPKSLQKKISEDIAFYLGCGMATLVNILSPRLIILQGSVIDIFGSAKLVDMIKVTLKERCLPGCMEKTDIKISQMEFSKTVGAATLAMSEYFEVADYCYV